MKKITKEDDFDILDLDLETETMKEIEEVEEIKSGDDLDLDLDSDIEDSILEAPKDPIKEEAKTLVVEPPKEIKVEKPPKKTKSSKKIELEKTEPTKTHFSGLVPDFDISLIKAEKYQTRIIPRTEEQLKSLIEAIKLQGQIEPIQISKEENGDYELLAGFGRYEAIQYLKQKTIKAIVHENISEETKLQISTGSNEARTELSFWDRVYSIGSYIERSGISISGNLDKLAALFGLKKSSIQAANAIYYNFKDMPELIIHFKKVAYPNFIYEHLYKKRDEIKEVKISELIDFLKIKGGKSDREFSMALVDFLVQSKIQKQIDTNIEVELDPVTPREKMKEKESLEKRKELFKGLEEYKIKVEETINSAISKLVGVEEAFLKLQEIPDVKFYIDNEKLKLINKRTQTILKYVSKFYA